MFKKGKLPWNKGLRGFKHSEETKRKIGEAARGNKWNVGKKLSPETKQKMSQTAKDRGFGKWMKGRTPWNKGKANVYSKETKEKISASLRGLIGEKSRNWRGGISTENNLIRSSIEYKDWRTAVFKRDNYTCQECGSRGYKLHADHIKPFAYYPELRLVIENGRTLCVECHHKTPTYGRPRKKEKKRYA